MDRHLKERLIGAAVLVAAAIIFIPEMLSGPHERTAESTAPPDANGVKTYTIDLAGSNTAAKNAEPAPAPEPIEFAPAPVPSHNIPTTSELNEPHDAASVAKDSAKAEGADARSVVTPSSKAESSPKADVSSEKAPHKNQSVDAQPKAEPRPAEKAVVPPVKSTPPAAGGWAVQVASFGQKPTADRIADELKAKGFSAFVTSIAVNNQTMYRVRVGPVEDRPAAEALLKKVKTVHPNAAVVTQ